MDRSLIGRRIELIRMEDPYTDLKQGDMGTIKHIDSIGQIHVNWDNGSTLAIVPEMDEYDIIEESLNKLNHVKLFDEFIYESHTPIKIKDPNSLIVGKKYKITWPNYDDYGEGLESEVDDMEVVGKNKVDGYILKHLGHGWTISRQPEMLKDCEIELLEENAKTKGEKYKGKHIPAKYLTRKKKAMKKEIDEFRGKKSYKKDWEADIDKRSGERIKTKKSAATKAYQKMFGEK